MRFRLQFYLNLLLLLTTINVTKSTVVHSFFRLLSSEQSTTGIVGKEVTTLSVRECSLWLVNIDIFLLHNKDVSPIIKRPFLPFYFTNFSLNFRCLNDYECKAYQHNVSSIGNCILIYKNSSADDGLTFSSTGQTSVYSKGSLYKAKSHSMKQVNA